MTSVKAREPVGNKAPLAIVTGASSGIGAAVVARLWDRGYRVAMLARRAEVMQRIAGDHLDRGLAIVVPVDLADAEAVEATIKRLTVEHGDADLFVHCAGQGLYRSYVDHEMDDHERLMQINYFSAVQIIGRVLPAMLKRGDGAIINVSSIAARMGPWGHSAYAASKAALVALTQSLASEHRGSGVRFSYVLPGIIDTPFYQCSEMADVWPVVRHRAIATGVVADRIVRLLDRHRLELCVPRHYRMLDWLFALSPSLANLIVSFNSRPQKPSGAGVPSEPAPAVQLAESSAQRVHD
ncbi:MAG: SDR family NAD(P)-dependent oxidoreductase [Phycisphaera sp.]|nr:SDR family NAD(P)-dependent oxidoreductase [Phycisphaera sp.]